MKTKYVPVYLAILVLASTGATAQSGDLADLKDFSVSPESGEYVMGEKVTTTFEYELDEITRIRAIETILVLDESGSMDGTKMDNVKTAAKNYVDQINVNAGDEVGLVAFDASPSKVNGLTSNKNAIKSSIDGLSASGNTNLGGGIDEADFYTSGDAVKAMVVLSDGKHNTGTAPEDPAEQARNNGVSVHGIMYGSGASTSDMEDVTGSQCTMDSSENSDGDNCWYATTGNIEDVYDSINNEIKESASGVKVHAEMANAEVPDDQYLSRNGDTYVLSAPSGTGNHQVSLTWYLTESGDDVTVKTGQSFLEYKVNGNEKTKQFPGGMVSQDDVEYMNIKMVDGSISKNQNGVKADLTLKNTGNHPIEGSEVSFYVNNKDQGFKKSTGGLQPGETKNLEISGVSPSSLGVSSSTDVVKAYADWNDEIIEESESDNSMEIGRVDMAPPQTSNNYTKTGWQNSTQKVLLQCSDVHQGKNSGCNQIDWRIEKSGEEVRSGTGLGSSTEVIMGAEEDGRLKLYYRSWDNAANIEDWESVQVKVDLSGPSVVVQKDVLDEGGLKASVVCKDLLSGCNDTASRIYLAENPIYRCPTDISRYKNRSPVDLKDERWVCGAGKDKMGNWDTSFEAIKFAASTLSTTLKSPGEYKAVYASEGSKIPVTMTVTNTEKDQKDVEMRLDGVSAEFSSNKQSQENFQLGSGEKREFQILVTPEKEGGENLEVEVEDQTEGIQIERRLTVNVVAENKRIRPTRNVPGPGLLHMMILILIATGYIFLRH